MSLNIQELLALANKLDQSGEHDKADELGRMLMSLAAGKKLDLRKHPPRDVPPEVAADLEKKRRDEKLVEEYLANQAKQKGSPKKEKAPEPAEPEKKAPVKRKKETAKEREARGDEEQAKRITEQEKEESIRQFKELSEKRMSDLGKYLDKPTPEDSEGTAYVPGKGEDTLEWYKEQEKKDKKGPPDPFKSTQTKEEFQKEREESKKRREQAEKESGLDWTEHRNPSGKALKIIEDMKSAGWQVFAPGELEYWLEQKGYEHPKDYVPTYDEDEDIPGVEQQPSPATEEDIPFDIDIEVEQPQQDVQPTQPEQPPQAPVPVQPQVTQAPVPEGQENPYADIDKWIQEQLGDLSMKKASSELPQYQPEAQEELIPGARERSSTEKEMIPGAREASMPVLMAFKSFLMDPQEGYGQLIKAMNDYRETNQMPTKQEEEMSPPSLTPEETESKTMSDDEAVSEIERAEREKGVVWSSKVLVMEKLADIADRLDVLGATEEASLVDGFIEKFAAEQDDMEHKEEDNSTEQSKRYDSKHHHNLQVREPKNKQERIDREGREKHHVHTMQHVEAHALSTRYCPDHVGVSLGRVGESTFQCPLDGAVYNWEAGWTDYDGNEHPGGSVASQTPDSSGYEIPHRMFDSRENILNRIN